MTDQTTDDSTTGVTVNDERSIPQTTEHGGGSHTQKTASDDSSHTQTTETDDGSTWRTARTDGGSTQTDEAATEGPTAEAIEPSVPAEFGLVQAWWGDGKGKTTAALGMGFRAAGHGYRVHLLQFMKGGTSTVEDVRGEYNAVAAMPGVSYENSGHYGWHGFMDGSDDDEHEARAAGGLARARELLDATREAATDEPIPLDAPPEAGVHMLILDEILYAANRGLVEPSDVLDLIAAKPPELELVVTGGHEEPTYLAEEADLITEVSKQRHPIDAGQGARKGTEY